jgi:2-haloacid dehalogenase
MFDVHSVASVAEESFPAHGVALARLWREKQIEYTRLRTLCDRYADFSKVTRDALVHSCARLRLELSERQCRQLLEYYACLPAYPDAVAVLERLHAAAIPLAILSNGTPQMLTSAIAAAGMSGLFQCVLSADQVRKFKTAPEVYRLGVEAFDCPPERLVFVSSNGWDVCCATWFGYRTFWLNRVGDPVEQLDVVPMGEGRDLHELVAFVGATR